MPTGQLVRSGRIALSRPDAEQANLATASLLLSRTSHDRAGPYATALSLSSRKGAALLCGSERIAGGGRDAWLSACR
jgi:hypothetical protein